MKFSVRQIAVAALCLGPVAASATIMNFDFTDQGNATITGSCGPYCFQVQSTGVASANDVAPSSPGTTTWSFTGLMDVLALGPLGIGVGDGSDGGGWRFHDTGGNNDIWGTFDAFLTLGSGSAAGQMDYTITGGTGIFNGAVGYGQSNVAFRSQGTFNESGKMHVAVPEPGALGLLGAAAVAFGAIVATRRRRMTAAPLADI